MVALARQDFSSLQMGELESIQLRTNWLLGEEVRQAGDIGEKIEVLLGQLASAVLH